MMRPTNLNNFYSQPNRTNGEANAPASPTPERSAGTVPQTSPGLHRTPRPTAFNNLPGRASGKQPSYQGTHVPYSPTPGASAGPSRIALGMQLQEWSRLAPPQERAARDKAVSRMHACSQGRTDCLDLSGLQLTSLPPALSAIKMKALILEGNSLQTLPELPPGLTALSVQGNALSSLPKLPVGLTMLDASNNKLTQIPDLPAHAWQPSSDKKFQVNLQGNLFSDRDLRAVHNHLKAQESGSTKHANVKFDTPTQIVAALEQWTSSAPPNEQPARLEAAKRLIHAHETNALSANLSGLALTSLPDCLSKLNVDELNLQDNKLQSLPALPFGLATLHVQNNALAALPALPHTLTNLNVQDNQLKHLPDLPSGLKALHASNNKLQQLDSLPPTLQVLRVGGNNLTSVPALPESLIGLDVSDNMLRQIPTLPDSAWSKDEHHYFTADLRDNHFEDADLRAFQRRINDTFDTDATARLRFQIEAPQPILVTPVQIASINSANDAKDAVKSWSYQGVPHAALVALRADLDAYMLNSTMPSEVFNKRHATSESTLSGDGKFFDGNSSIDDSSLRKNFVRLRMALPTS